MKGNLLNCSLTPNGKDYNYNQTIQELHNKYDFNKIGEGGFGLILGTENCVIKLIKDINRCNELEKEREVYRRIKKEPASYSMYAKFPKYFLYEQLDTFRHFNMQKLYSPLSGYMVIYLTMKSPVMEWL